MNKPFFDLINYVNYYNKDTAGSGHFYVDMSQKEIRETGD